MKTTEPDPLFQEYAAFVLRRLQAEELSSIFPDCSQLLVERVQEMPAWQVALPAIACQAAGGSLEDGLALASAWCPIYLASEMLDSVEDKEFIPDRFAPFPEAATNLATGLIFAAFHTLASLQNPDRAQRAARVFSSSGFSATYGQHRDLLKIPSPVEEALHDYWEMVMLKSGSVFRIATAGGAAAGISDEAIVDALGDYGTALGVMLQLMDDCRDAFNPSEEAVNWEISLPLLLYLMTVGKETIAFPQVSSRAEWSELLTRMGVIHAISSLLLEWKMRALASLAPLHNSREKRILEMIPSIFLERIRVNIKEACKS